MSSTLSDAAQASASHAYLNHRGDAVALPSLPPPLPVGFDVLLPSLSPILSPLLPGESLPLLVPSSLLANLIASAAPDSNAVIFFLPLHGSAVGSIVAAVRAHVGASTLLLLSRQRGRVGRGISLRSALCSATALPLVRVLVLDPPLGEEGADGAAPREALAGHAHHAAALYAAYHAPHVAARVARVWEEQRCGSRGGRQCSSGDAIVASHGGMHAFSWLLARSVPASISDRTALFEAHTLLQRLFILHRLLQARSRLTVSCAGCGALLVGDSSALVHPFEVNAQNAMTGALNHDGEEDLGGGAAPPAALTPLSFSFTNPAGVSFRLITTLRVCRDAIVMASFPPTCEASWFPGYAWLILCCHACRAHVGWRYDWAPEDALADLLTHCRGVDLLPATDDGLPKIYFRPAPPYGELSHVMGACPEGAAQTFVGLREEACVVREGAPRAPTPP